MSAGKIVLLVFGVIVLLMSVGLVFGGGALLWANSALTDDEGFFTTRFIQLEKGSYAIVTEPAEIDLSAAWIWDWSNLVTFKVEGYNDDPTKQIFIGIAEESDLDVYLHNVEYYEITDFSIYPYEIDYRHHSGGNSPAPPGTQEIWTESAYGPGTQSLEWTLDTGTYSMVLMNQDGSAGLDLRVAVGAKVPLVFGTGLGFLIGGVVGLIIGFFMVFLAVRRA
jgi:hypothetical protein